jgi:hypothetical protein
LWIIRTLYESFFFVLFLIISLQVRWRPFTFSLTPDLFWL